MSTDKLIKFYILDKKNLNLVPSSKAKLIIVKATVIKPDLIKPKGAIMLDEALFFIPFCSMIFLAILIWKLLDIWKVAIAKITTLNCFHQLPCRSCRFFTNNHYLYCTVHPSIVLTEQALDCSDYCSLSED
ncbi:MAG: hypothetical protein V7K86_14075 [Nostoc sp.]|uniref:hypothetical protein n=1 Tax=Nostoc sp. TaxID=1180 RepID=UPI002FF536E9